MCVIEGALTALLIDELPVLAAIAPFTAGGLEVRDAGELRVKESDRLSAVTRNLQAMGAQVEQTEDGWRIPGGQRLHGAEIESYDDHRIAMAFAIAALQAEGETRDSQCGVRRESRIPRSSRTWRNWSSGRRLRSFVAGWIVFRRTATARISALAAANCGSPQRLKPPLHGNARKASTRHTASVIRTTPQVTASCILDFRSISEI